VTGWKAMLIEGPGGMETVRIAQFAGSLWCGLMYKIEMCVKKGSAPRRFLSTVRVSP